MGTVKNVMSCLVEKLDQLLVEQIVEKKKKETQNPSISRENDNQENPIQVANLQELAHPKSIGKGKAVEGSERSSISCIRRIIPFSN